jgi:CRP-like cAMP-binding protein
MEITMYDTLLQLPLFQGLCKNDFTNIIGKVKLHFHKYNADDIIVEQGAPCTQLIFLLNGEIISQTTDNRHSYALFETFGSPFVIEPYSLFGMQTNYTATYKARTDINIVTIDKLFVLNELNNYEIFRLNYLNILSNRAQVAYEKLWNSHIGNTEEKILNFLVLRSMKPEGKKILKIKMEDLASLIDETRINVSKVLNDLQEQGLVQLSRKEISIPALEKLTEKNK